MACVCAAAGTAFAQNDYPVFDVFVGYSLMGVSDYENIDIEQARFFNELYYGTGLLIIAEKSNVLKNGFAVTFTYNSTSI